VSSYILSDWSHLYPDHDSEKLKKENLNVTFIRLDVTNIETIRAAKDSIEKIDGKLDVLVNNAGKKSRFCASK
jgi:NAD(P)-dependent dehydrogenase (short-subunit alcohol dehydrogenase family)